MPDVEVLRRNLASIQSDIQAACRKSGRDPHSVRIVAVIKTLDASSIPDLLDAGLKEFGENRWQQARPKLAVPRSSEAVWHFIGRLQSNKIKDVVPRFDWVHSVDSLDLAKGISRVAAAIGKRIKCLVQVNVSGEATKAGVQPDKVVPLVRDMSVLPGVDVCGLMTMAPVVEDPEDARPVFRSLRELLLDARNKTGVPLKELSMGMSGDYVVAVEEGATMVRIGRRLVSSDNPL